MADGDVPKFPIRYLPLTIRLLFGGNSTMSELISAHSHSIAKLQLLTTASALALLTYASTASAAKAEDSGRPTVWLELGSQMERASGGDNAFDANFYSRLDPLFSSPQMIQNALPLALGAEAKISLKPESSDWVFAASIRYGRSSSRRSLQQQTNPGEVQNLYPYIYKYNPPSYFPFKLKCCNSRTFTPSNVEFEDIQSRHQETHLILDFEAGKDVGLGAFGRSGSSVMSVGVRFAQFTTSSDTSVKARTDMQHYNRYTLPQYGYFFNQFPQIYKLVSKFNAFSLVAGSARDTEIIGPSLSWDASAALAGNPDVSELTFDWGINAAVLFGKQKAKTHHQSSGHYKPGQGFGNYTTLYYHAPKHYTRSRAVTVPNVGGMAGFSLKWPDAKISIGYRADIFFGAMDAGWDTRKVQNRSFYGPFASISVGLGG